MNTQALLDLVKTVEAVPEEKFQMNLWVSDCGTMGCLWGHYCLAKGIAIDTYDSVTLVTDRIEDHFEITHYEADWLFALLPSSCMFADTFVRRDTLTNVTKEEALNRVRKFIYYKLKKAEMSYEEARLVDGNKAAIHAQLMTA